MNRPLSSAILILYKLDWPCILLLETEEEYNDIYRNISFIRYTFEKFNREFNLYFQRAALPGYYAIQQSDRSIKGLQPVTYEEFFSYTLYAFTMLFKNPTVSDWYEFFFEWCRSNDIDMNSFFFFHDTMIKLLTAVGDKALD